MTRYQDQETRRGELLREGSAECTHSGWLAQLRRIPVLQTISGRAQRSLTIHCGYTLVVEKPPPRSTATELIHTPAIFTVSSFEHHSSTPHTSMHQTEPSHPQCLNRKKKNRSSSGSRCITGHPFKSLSAHHALLSPHLCGTFSHPSHGAMKSPTPGTSILVR